MAADRDVQDLQAHVGSYARFSAMMKWSTIVASIATAIVVILIAS